MTHGSVPPSRRHEARNRCLADRGPLRGADGGVQVAYRSIHLTDSMVDMGVSGSGGQGTDASGPACGGHLCAATQICCVLDGTCIVPTYAAASCTKPTMLPRGAARDTDLWLQRGLRGDWSSASPLRAVSALGFVSSETTAAPARAEHGAVVMASATRMFRRRAERGVKPQVTSRLRLSQYHTPGDANHDPMIFCGSDTQCPNGLTCCPITRPLSGVPHRQPRARSPSPRDGATVITGAADGTLRLWDPRNPHLRAPLPPPG